MRADGRLDTDVCDGESALNLTTNVSECQEVKNRPVPNVPLHEEPAPAPGNKTAGG
jgi:hypothetical protein